MATKRQKNNWLITILVVIGVGLAAAFNSDKIKGWVAQVPFLKDVLK